MASGTGFNSGGGGKVSCANATTHGHGEVSGDQCYNPAIVASISSGATLLFILISWRLGRCLLHYSGPSDKKETVTTKAKRKSEQLEAEVSEAQRNALVAEELKFEDLRVLAEREFDLEQSEAKREEEMRKLRQVIVSHELDLTALRASKKEVMDKLELAERRLAAGNEVDGSGSAAGDEAERASRLKRSQTAPCIRGWWKEAKKDTTVHKWNHHDGHYIGDPSGLHKLGTYLDRPVGAELETGNNLDFFDIDVEGTEVDVSGVLVGFHRRIQSVAAGRLQRDASAQTSMTGSDIKALVIALHPEGGGMALQPQNVTEDCLGASVAEDEKECMVLCSSV